MPATKTLRGGCPNRCLPDFQKLAEKERPPGVQWTTYLKSLSQQLGFELLIEQGNKLYFNLYMRSRFHGKFSSGVKTSWIGEFL